MKYNTLVIDPPWPISMTGKFKIRQNRATRLPYPVMTIEDIKSLQVQSLIADGGHVYLWCTNSTLRSAFDVLDSWGLRFSQALVMTKPSGLLHALGYVSGTEFCLLAFAGRPMQPFQGSGAMNHFSHTPVRGQHSTKPDTFYKTVEKMSPGPYADLFARQKRAGWDVWGNEVESDFGILA